MATQIPETRPHLLTSGLTYDFSAGTRRLIEALDVISSAEQQLPVADWLHGGVHVWPIARHYLFKHALLRYARGFTSVDSVKTYARLFEWRRRIPAILAPKSDFLLDLEDGGGRNGLLLVGNNTGVTRIGGGSFQHHLDPYRLAAGELGVDTTMLLSGLSDKGIGASYGLTGRTRSLKPLYRHLALRGRFVAVCDSAVPELGRIVRQVAQVIGMRGTDLAHHIDIAVSLTANAAPLFARYLETRRTRGVLAYNYASFVGWSLAHACRALTIPMADVQHGVQGRFNGSYLVPCGPRGGWNVMPPRAVVWGEGDKMRFERSEPGYRATVAGPSSLVLLKYLLDSPASGPDREKLAAVRSALQRESREAWQALSRIKAPKIVFASQSMGDVEFGSVLARQDAFRLLYRVHPVQYAKNQGQGTEAAGPADVVKLATLTPLPILLAGVDGLVTGHSATFLEAARLNVPSIMMSELARLLAVDYGEEYAGTLHFSDRDAAKIAALVSGMTPNAVSGEERFANALAQLPRSVDVLGDLLGKR